jgi:hypothetical protein
MVRCLGSEHRKLDGLILQFAFAATRLAGDSEAVTAIQQAAEVWDEIRLDLWSHLQTEDELVLSWGGAHHAISATSLDTLKSERQERKLVAALPASSSSQDREPQTAEDRSAFAQTLLALARTLDSQVERYDGEVLPSILGALFHKGANRG